MFGARAPWRLAGVFVALSLGWGGWLGYRHYEGDRLGLEGFEDLTADLRFRWRGPRRPSDEVVVVALDEETIRAAGGFPLGRGTIAEIVAAIAATKPSVVAIDMAFVDPGDAAETGKLAAALRAGPSLLAALGEAAPASPRAAPRLSVVLPPIPVLAAVAAQGLANIDSDSGGVARFAPMLFDTPAGPDRSFALAVLTLARHAAPVLSPHAIAIGPIDVITDYGYYAPINYYGPSGSFRQIGAARALRGELKPEETRGRVVLIGATAVGVADKFASPFDPVLPGVEVWATVIANALAHEGLVVSPGTRALDAAAAVLLPLSALAALEALPILAGAGVAALALLAWAVAVFAAFTAGYWLSVGVPLAAYAPTVSAYALARIFTGQARLRRADAEKARLGVFQPPSLRELVAGDPGFLAAPTRCDLTVVFADLSGSTGMAEALGPEASHAILAEFQTLVDREVGAKGGVLIAFIGDGALAVFGFPRADGGDAARALAALDALKDALARWLDDLPAGAQRLDFRIGAHFGPALVSRIGPPDHQQITVTGDTVNVANRLLGVAKEHGCRLVVTEEAVQAALRAAALDARAQTAASFLVTLRGRVAPVRVRIWG